GEGLRVKARRAAAERAAPLPALPFVDESRLPRTMWPTATCSARHRAARLGLLSELRRPADGRDGRVARGRCPAAPAGPPMGAVAAVCAAPSARDPARGRHAGARHRLSRDLGVSDPQGRPDTCERCDRTVTLIQRFGSALNLNVHFHLRVLDGVYRREGEGRLRFVPVPVPTSAELNRLVQRIAERVGRSLERSGLIARDIENAYLTFDPAEEAPINSLLGASITYRIATGLREGQKVFTLQTLPG